MVRWRLGMMLALLLLLPTILGKTTDDDEEEERRSEESEEDDEEDEDEEDEGEEKSGRGDVIERHEMPIPRRRAQVLATKGMAPSILDPDRESIRVRSTERTKKRPLECFVCAYKSETPLRACLDPTKFRVHTITCHSVDDRCFTSVLSKEESYEAVVRGCRSSCVGSAETTCCDLNRCNNQAFAIPLVQQRPAPRPTPQQRLDVIPLASKTNRLLPPSVMFFVTILLILQTVSKVTCF
ncbi:hypothetical protein O0L34_g13910 [Tuta absoluta]|nr:hypothetical protein O0L34_g13910 [Tuta absoluta]